MGAAPGRRRSGKPNTRPAPWGSFSGNANDHGDFPFQTSWLYDGKRGFSADFQYSGGVLANNATWGGSPHLYYTDGIADSHSSAEAPLKLYGKSSCIYSGQVRPPIWDIWFLT